MKPESVTVKNLEAAFAGESMAHIKYRYFAKLAREAGDEDTARIFEETANQEVAHAFGHLDLLYPKAQLTPAKSKEHAAAFRAVLEKAAKRFAALAKVEERHANHYREQLAKIAK